MASILTSGNENSRYYGGFRGVDFTSDHTQVHDQRLAYAVNMYKDYQSGEGQALETIPGFRKRVITPCGGEIFGIHHYTYRGADGVSQKRVLIHAGERLYHWHNYPDTIGVLQEQTVTLPEGTPVEAEIPMLQFQIALGDNVKDVESVTVQNGDAVSYKYDAAEHTLTVTSSTLKASDLVYITYKEGLLTLADALYSTMNQRKSTSFVFNNRLYIIDGKNYLVYDGTKVQSVLSDAYVPTTYINIIPSGENADIGTEYEQRNILQPKFKHTFIADGTTTEFYMNDYGLDAIAEVRVYGDIVTNYTADTTEGKITFDTAPKAPQDAGYPEMYAGVEITASKKITSVNGVIRESAEIGALITGCTIACVFDNRVFLSGHPDLPNHLFWCGRNITGYTDPTYFGVLNYMQDGVETSPITGLVPVADTLMVLKGDTQQDGMVFFHTPVETGENLSPKIYPSTQGLHGVGCLGACINFLDDPVFVSRLGVEAVGQLSVRYERAVEHRSSLIDAKLTECDLSRATLEEWDGYLLLAVDGKIFMADSRQQYTHDIGTKQYEWYYLEDIGVWDEQYREYVYATQMEPGLEGAMVEFITPEGVSEQISLVVASNVHFDDTDEDKDLTGTTANPADIDGKKTGEIHSAIFSVTAGEGEDEISYDVPIYYAIHYDKANGYRALLCRTYGAHIGGVFKPAVLVKGMDKNIFFGTENGVVCSFNMDKREDGQIPTRYYTFDERAIRSGCATKMDNCGIPHLTKTTVKKSTVIKTKSLQTSATKVKIRTNKQPYKQIARINSSVFSFDDLDFADFSFATDEQSLFAVRENEKKWVEKQYYVYSDEYMRPFSLYYIAFRYRIAGRYKG